MAKKTNKKSVKPECVWRPNGAAEYNCQHENFVCPYRVVTGKVITCKLGRL